jgi:hypothetical protein
MSRQTQINAKTKDHELTVHDHQTDSPLLPIAQIERLHAIRPDRVDWVFDQTEAESKARRKQSARIHTFVFVERMLGLLCAFTIGLAGLAGAVRLAYHDEQIAAVGIGGATLASLVSAFLYAGKNKD